MNAQTAEDAPNKGVNKWYGLYNHLKGTKEDATSSMIWGCQYDQTIKFIGAEAQVGHIDRDLANGSGRASGVTEQDVIKNIYDLEGNYWEWTVLANSTTSRLGRGGSYYNVANSNFYPASRRGSSYPTYTSANVSSRPTLYM